MFRNRKLLLLVPTIGIAAVLGTLLPTSASSHREAPLISEDPVADTTDVYAFVSPDRPDFVNLIANWIPFEEPAGGPNFHKFGNDAKYLFKIDNNGDAVEDITYEFRFTSQIQNDKTFLYNTGPIESIDDKDYNQRQVFTVARIDGGQRTVLAENLLVPPANIGPRSTPNYGKLNAQAVNTLDKDGGTKVFAGPRDDPFFVDLGSVFDLAGLRPLNQAHLIKQKTAPGVDNVAGYNVHTIALQIPKARLTASKTKVTDPKDTNAIIGVWATTERFRTRALADGGALPASSGDFVQVSRLGMPLVNEVVVPLAFKDVWNGSKPADDGRFIGAVQDPEVSRLIPVLYPGVKVPATPRNDLVSIFLTGIPGLNQPANVKGSEMIRLNTAIPPRAFGKESPIGLLGGDMAGFPNGRRLTDDVTDIELRALAGGTPFTPSFNKSPNNVLGDGVSKNDRDFLRSFPYVALPHSGYDSRPHSNAAAEKKAADDLKKAKAGSKRTAKKRGRR